MLHHCLALHTPIFGIPARHTGPQASLSGGIFHLYHHFAGYMLAGVLSIFIMLRVVHGLAFGMVTVAGNTIVIDITPSSRRGEAVGYYGLMNNTAMSFGPMIGLFMHDIYSFETIFACSLISGTIGFVAACLVKTPPKQPVKREPISLDRFVLLKGIPAGIALLLLSIPYGMTSTYVAMYAKEIGITLNSGLFLLLWPSAWQCPVCSPANKWIKDVSPKS